MVLQLEDFIDCLTVLHPEFNYLFLFDHSCGHNRQCKDNAGKMLEGYVGKQLKMRATEIKQKEGFIGPYQAPLKPGNVQQMVFGPNDVEPCWMTPKECEAK
jgi:hypothetical protein